MFDKYIKQSPIVSLAGMSGGLSNYILYGSSGDGEVYEISRSLRFDDGDSAYLSRAPGSPSDKAVWTFSFWIKIHNADQNKQILSVYTDSSNDSLIKINGNGFLEIWNYRSGSYQTQYLSNSKYKDVSAWYHFVISCNDSTSLNAWVNGQAVTWSTSSGPNGVNWLFNSTNTHQIGRYNTTATSDFTLADVHWIDGEAKSQSDFGQYDTYGVWQPKEYTGNYGTNGYYLKFNDFSSNASLGTDSSGNNNTWTVNNFTATSLAWASTTWSNDISIDSGNVYLNNQNGPNGFDGNSSTYIDCRLGTGANNTTNIIWEPTGGISGVTKIRVNSNYASHYRINEGSWTSFSSGGSYTQIYNGSAFTLTKLEIRRNDNSGSDYGHRVIAYELNDVEVRDNLAQSADGSGIDSLIDSPTNYTSDSGSIGGNYATLNPLDKSTTAGTYSNGNLDFTRGSGYGTAKSNFGMRSGKWYCEVVRGSGNTVLGIMDQLIATDYLDRGSSGYGYRYDGTKVHNNQGHGNIGSYSSTDVVGLAFDADNNNLYFYKNGSQVGSFTSVTTVVPNSPWFFAFSAESTTLSVNFGQRPFVHTPPTGYKALCSENLSHSVLDGSEYFDTKLWTGDGNSTRSISNYSFSPDFVWIKNRTTSGWQHVLYDQIRGAGTSSVTKSLSTDQNRTEASGNDTNHGYLSGFTSNGFDLTKGSQSTGDYVNHNNWEYVGWAWDAGSTTASNTDGTITSSVRANTSAGFSIVNFTADGTAGDTVGHGLGAKPEFIIYKDLEHAQNWGAYHVSFGGEYGFNFNTADSIYDDTGYFNDTDPTSSVITLGSYVGYFGTHEFIAYCWTPVEGFSAFGSYEGNGSGDGPFVNTGFRPAWVLYKNADASGGWQIYDSDRDPFNQCDARLQSNSSGAEDTEAAIEIMSNGFKQRATHARSNANGNTYVYAAFAEHPLKTSRAR